MPRLCRMATTVFASGDLVAGKAARCVSTASAREPTREPGQRTGGGGDGKPKAESGRPNDGEILGGNSVVDATGAQKKKTVAELDEELRMKMEGVSGGGGSAGVEYENGKAEGLKRGVKENMFRLI